MPSPTPHALIARRAAALKVYNDLHTSDGVTASAWLACATELAEVAWEICLLPNSTRSEVRFIEDRAIDAGHEASACKRRTADAASRWTGLHATATEVRS